MNVCVNHVSGCLCVRPVWAQESVCGLDVCELGMPLDLSECVKVACARPWADAHFV